jgi:hypothetical protein
MAIVHVLNSHTTKEKHMLTLLRKLVLTLYTHNIVLKAHHVPGVYNILSDKLSRLQITQALELGPHLVGNQVIIPETLDPMLLLQDN